MHTSPCGKRYIGITGQKPIYRWKNGKGYKANPHFTRAIELYGWENFAHEIIEVVGTLEEAKKEEIRLIALYRSNESDFGYNISAGGDGYNFNLTEEEKKKRRADRQKRYMADPEKRKRRNEWEREYCKSDTYKKKKNEYNKTDHRKNHRREYMRIYRETQKNKEYRREYEKKKYQDFKKQSKPAPEEQKKHGIPVLQFDENMNLIAEYPSIKNAASSVGTCFANIKRACNFKNLKAKGYFWRIKNDYSRGHEE